MDKPQNGADLTGTVKPLVGSTLAKQVEALENEVARKQQCRCGEIKATMWVNFGPEGKTKAGLVDEGMDQMAMILSVLRHYIYTDDIVTDETYDPAAKEREG